MQSAKCKVKSVLDQVCSFCILIFALCTLHYFATSTALAYVEIPYTLGRLVQESTHIMLVRVEKVDKERNLIIYRKVQDLKGTHPTDVIKHNIGRGGFHPREWQTIMDVGRAGQDRPSSSTTAAPARRASATTGTRRTPAASGGT